MAAIRLYYGLPVFSCALSSKANPKFVSVKEKKSNFRHVVASELKATKMAASKSVTVY